MPQRDPTQETALLLRELAATTQRLNRSDLAERARAAAARIARPATIVCVVGQFKQGKSSLINALLGAPICPVDDDLATSVITLVHFAPAPVAYARRRKDGSEVVQELPVGDVNLFVSETGNPANAQKLERVDVGLPHPLLERGLALVDTPGAGGLDVANSAATLAFLPYADALLFVSSATAELSQPELDFLARARERCPVVVCCLTKTDMAIDWRRIADLDRQHLARAGIEAELLPLAAPVRMLALERQDRLLDEESGYPALLTELSDHVIAPAKARAATRGVAEGHAIAEQVTTGLSTELALLESPDSARQALAELERARERLEHLRGPGARWSVLLGDRMTDLANQASYQLRSSLRAIGRKVDQDIESVDSVAAWEEMSRDVCEHVADSVSGIFEALEKGAHDVHGEIAVLLRDEQVDVSAAGDRVAVDVSRLWPDAPFATKEGGLGALAGQAMAGLRGGYGGLFLFSILGRFLPAGAAALLFSNPVSLGIGVAFAGQSLLEANRRKLAARRQAARVAARQFIDDVLFEVGNQLTERSRALHRELRDEFSDRVAEAQRTLVETIQRGQEDVQGSKATRAERVKQLRDSIATLTSLRDRLGVHVEA